jgi:tRNA(Ile)-lysidine synthase
MLAGGETVLVAVSGGPDSVALLYLLRELAATWHLTLHVLHVDHQLRADSARDGEAVRRLAADLRVPAEVVRVTVAGRASLEAAARAARYRALAARAEQLGAHRIALGHTADDQAETVAMRLLEGSGVRGLAGIPPMRGRVIRPLIAESRAALRVLLTEAQLPWLDDPSNRDPRFLRNRIRHELLPMLAASYNPRIGEALTRVGRLMRGTADALERVATRELERLARGGEGELVLPLAALEELPPDVAAEVLRLGACRLGRRAPLRGWAHRGLRRALVRPSPRRVFEVGGVAIEVSVGHLRLAVSPPATLPVREVPVPGRVALPEAGLVLESSLAAGPGSIPCDPGEVVFDADALTGPLVVRGRCRGDRLIPFGAAGERRVKALLLEARLPRWERGRVPIVQAGSELIWVAGIRRGAAAPVTPGTRRVLHLRLSPLAKDPSRG